MSKDKNAAKKLESGSLNNKSFDVLLSLTSIRSEPLKAALRDYYVKGLSKSEAYTKHAVDKTIFSRRLPVLQEVFDKVLAFNRVYENK
ncbi:MAG: adhesin biosynthesis transcription regulatory family protein [Pseudomonadales bacterium]|nr:adhesin biosynthesis transcription regulatory family protein [Pseudomonadales bacterium]